MEVAKKVDLQGLESCNVSEKNGQFSLCKCSEK